MTTHEKKTRSRLSTLGDDSLDDGAIARIADRLAVDGPGVVRRARRVHVAQQVGVAGLAVACVALGVSLYRGGGVAPARPCESWAAASIIEGDRVLTIADRAVVKIDDATDVRVAHAEACRTVLRLGEGRVVVHAQDLGGGELSVETAAGVARVHGTVFAVEHRDRLVVEVAEGVVEVEAVSSERVVLRAGQGTRVAGGRVEALSVAPSRVAELIRSVASDSDLGTGCKDGQDGLGQQSADPSCLSLYPVQNPDPDPDPKTFPSSRLPVKSPGRQPQKATSPQADELVRRASDLRRAGDLDGARAAYRSAGAMSGATAEAAWIALARLELSVGRAKDALDALEERTRRFPSGALEIEEAWLRVQAYEAANDAARAKAEAESIVRRWPGTVQASAAKRWLEGRTQ